MTRFPLEARGELDADPVTHIDRRAFDDAMRRMLAQDSGRSATPESVAVFLAQSSQLEPTAVTPDGGAARVADFQFERVDAGWRLTRIYLQGERR